MAEPKQTFWLRAHIDLQTIKQGPYLTMKRAREEAEHAAVNGIWDDKVGRRLYPPHAIVYIEIIEGEVG